MSPDIILSRLRRFLLVFSGLLFAGALGELWLTGHTENFVQWIPFGLCGLGLLVVLLALFRPRRGVLLALRACMAAVTLGSLYGIYEHVANNVAFLQEIDPGAPTGDLVLGALGGANPLLAPGVLTAAAVLAMAASYYHSALKRDGAALGE
ncbi:MAG: hypothetical protein ACRD9R_21905 [Pyrinomonadaceae bacterium]